LNNFPHFTISEMRSIFNIINAFLYTLPNAMLLFSLLLPAVKLMMNIPLSTA